MTGRQRQIRIFEIIEHDGIKCLYCKLDTDDKTRVIDHLDNNPFNNNPENHCICHSKCNLDKKINHDYEIIAKDQLGYNQKRVITSLIDDKSKYGNSPEIQHNIDVKDFIKSSLNDELKSIEELLFSEYLNGLTYLAGEKFGHCSQVTVRRHLDSLCSIFGPFKKIKNKDGKYVIVKRGVED